MFSFGNQCYFKKYYIRNNVLREYLRRSLQNYINNKLEETKQNKFLNLNI